MVTEASGGRPLGLYEWCLLFWNGAEAGDQVIVFEFDVA